MWCVLFSSLETQSADSDMSSIMQVNNSRLHVLGFFSPMYFFKELTVDCNFILFYFFLFEFSTGVVLTLWEVQVTCIYSKQGQELWQQRAVYLHDRTET